MEELDQWVLHRLQELSERVLKAYESFEFHPVFHNLHNFCVLDLSAFYLDILKDRLYVSPARSKARRSAQSALHEILETLVRLMAPVLSFTADEIWQAMGGQNRCASVHMETFFPVKKEYKNEALAERWEHILKVRKEVTKAMEIERKNKTIGHSLEASITLGLPGDLIERLKPYREALPFLFIVSSVTTLPLEQVTAGYEGEGIKVKVEISKDPRCERCWVHDPTVGKHLEQPGLCKRCLDALAEMG
jgi:isoleucyl-tRNA synthetase